MKHLYVFCAESQHAKGACVAGGSQCLWRSLTIMGMTSLSFRAGCRHSYVRMQTWWDFQRRHTSSYRGARLLERGSDVCNCERALLNSLRLTESFADGDSPASKRWRSLWALWAISEVCFRCEGGHMPACFQLVILRWRKSKKGRHRVFITARMWLGGTMMGEWSITDIYRTFKCGQFFG